MEQCVKVSSGFEEASQRQPRSTCALVQFMLEDVQAMIVMGRVDKVWFRDQCTWARAERDGTSREGAVAV